MEKKLNRNDTCWCGSGRKYKSCHYNFDETIATYRRMGVEVPARSLIKNQAQIAGIKESCKVNIEILDRVTEQIAEGITTEEIDRIVRETTAEYGAVAAPLGYGGFPKSVCTSVNDQVCHGIPSSEVVLRSGDIVNVDVSTILDGYYSDSSRMFAIGEISEENRRLIEVTREALYKGLEQVRPWGRLGDVGAAVHKHALDNGYTVVKEIGGHGVGLEFHEDPWVGFTTSRGTGMLLAPGMIFTIEPMVNMGKAELRAKKEDEWPVHTADGSNSAQWEIMVLVTPEGYEVLAY